MISAFLALTVLTCTEVQTIGPDKYGKTTTTSSYDCNINSGHSYIRKTEILSMEERYDKSGNEYCVTYFPGGWHSSVLERCHDIARKIHK